MYRYLLTRQFSQLLGESLSTPKNALFISYKIPLTDYAHLHQHQVQAEAKVKEGEGRDIQAGTENKIHSAENSAVPTRQFNRPSEIG